MKVVSIEHGANYVWFAITDDRRTLKMGEGLQRATAAAIATQLNEGDFKFMRLLARWQYVASSKDLGPQTSQDENRARQKCKRKGLVTYDGGNDGYWRMTDLGKLVLRC